MQTKSEAGRSKGRCGATVLARWKTPRISAAARIVHASARRVILAALTEAHARASGVTTMREATGVSEVRFARVAAGRQRPPGRLRRGETCDPPKRIALNVTQAISSIARARKRLTHREPTRRGCSYEDVRWQKSVRRIARRDARGAARQVVGTALAQGRFARRADARSEGQPRGENGVRSCVTLSVNETSAARRLGQPGRA